MPAITGRGQPWPFLDFWVITFDQNSHHLYSSSAKEKDLSNDSQIRVIGLMGPEICTKILKKLIKKTQSKISCHYTWLLMVKIARLDEASLEVF